MHHTTMGIRRPTREQLRKYARQNHLNLSNEEFDVFYSLIDDQLEAIDRLDDLQESLGKPEHRYGTSGYRPAAENNPDNAIISFCDITTESCGNLTKRSIGVKDNIAVAGVPMTCGSRTLTEYIPQEDATVVSRILSAGGTITAKTNMDDFAWSGSGEISAFGSITNPQNPDFLAGGSSGGSAAAVANGTVDMALGTDQGGSVRIPASWCGVVGFKPTHGLVPYTGTVTLESTVDHIGPITRDVEDCARLLDVISGPDGCDPRQYDIKMTDHLDAIRSSPNIDDLTIGVLQEGFDREESETVVDDTVQGSIDELAEAGATVKNVSVPYHLDGGVIVGGITIEGAAARIRSNGIQHSKRDTHDTKFSVKFGRVRQTSPDKFPPMMKLTLLLGEYLSDQYYGKYYSKAQRLLDDLKGAYDESLDDVDVLALPTTPHLPHEITKGNDLEEIMSRALSMNGNTGPFNGSGHPSISIPCGNANNLPVGLMLVGPYGGDGIVLQAAKTIEDTFTDTNRL